MTMNSLIFSSLKQGSSLDEQNRSRDLPPGKETPWASAQEMTLGGLENDDNCSLLCLRSQYEICKLERLLASESFALLIFYNFWGIIKVIQFFRIIHLNFFGPSVFVLAGTVVNASFQSCFTALPEHGEESTQNYY